MSDQKSPKRTRLPPDRFDRGSTSGLQLHGIGENESSGLRCAGPGIGNQEFVFADDDPIGAGRRQGDLAIPEQPRRRGRHYRLRGDCFPAELIGRAGDAALEGDLDGVRGQELAARIEGLARYAAADRELNAIRGVGRAHQA